MNAIRNQVQLIGRAGNQPELKKFENGAQMVRMSVATNEIYKNSEGEKITDTQWHTVIAWGKVAENLSRIVTKGNEIAIHGKLVHRTYEDRSGVKRYITEVIANDFLQMTTRKAS